MHNITDHSYSASDYAKLGCKDNNYFLATNGGIKIIALTNVFYRDYT